MIQVCQTQRVGFEVDDWDLTWQNSEWKKNTNNENVSGKTSSLACKDIRLNTNSHTYHEAMWVSKLSKLNYCRECTGVLVGWGVHAKAAFQLGGFRFHWEPTMPEFFGLFAVLTAVSQQKMINKTLKPQEFGRNFGLLTWNTSTKKNENIPVLLIWRFKRTFRDQGAQWHNEGNQVETPQLGDMSRSTISAPWGWGLVWLVGWVLLKYPDWLHGFTICFDVFIFSCGGKKEWVQNMFKKLQVTSCYLIPILQLPSW